MIASALVRDGNDLREDPEPPLLTGSSRVMILRAGVCGTDLQIIRGDRDDQALILGHEAVGTVEGNPDRLVVFNPVATENQDRILGHSYDGVFRHFFPLDSEHRPELVQVPSGLPLELYVLCEPVAAALYGWELATDLPAQRVGIWGAGPLGLIHTYLALSKGVRVRLAHRHASRLSWAQRLFGGEVECVLPGNVSAPDLDLAFICSDRSGTDAALAEAVASMRPDGLIVLVGGSPRKHRIPALPDIDLDAVRRANVSGLRGPGGGVVDVATAGGKPIRLTGHRGTSALQILAAQREIAAAPHLFSALITHVVDANAALALIRARCAHRQQDSAGKEIVKIAIRFGELRSP